MTTTDATRKTESETPWRWLSRKAPHSYALILGLLSLVLFSQPLRGLFNLSLHDEHSSHILLIPVISGFLVYLQKARVFRVTRYCPVLGASTLLMAAVLWRSLQTPLSHLNNTDRLSVVTALMVIVWFGIFVLGYGTVSLRAAIFPMVFLVLMIPIPVAAASQIVSLLQKGSADTCYTLFRVIGVPVIRHGFLFSLPGVDIEVAEQCSGINSALSLLIAGLLAGHVFLQTSWKRVCFVLCIVPIAIFKNAVRIVTIAWLGIHVNPDFFHGALHHHGGLPFSLLALALMALVMWLLKHPVALSEAYNPSKRLSSSAA